MAQLVADLGGVLPTYLVSNISVGPIREGVLTLFVGHGALAARLRQLEPSLLQNLHRRGWAIHAFKIRIHPYSPPVQSTPKMAHLSPLGLSCLDRLHQQLAPSPLRMALTHLLERHRRI